MSANDVNKCYVDIILIEATELRKISKTTNGTTKIQLKKPFCRLIMGKQDIETKGIKSAIHPVWNDDATFTIYDEFQELRILLFDKIKRGIAAFERLMGQVHVNINEYKFNHKYDIWKEFEPPPTSDAKNLLGSGKVHFQLYKSRDYSKGPLQKFGRPLLDIPIRLNAGDIVLVSNRGITLQHTVKVTTRSKWDHVGMVVGVRDKPFCRLFEATMDGVETYSLNNSLVEYRRQAKVGIRRLSNERRSNHAKDNLLVFVEEVIGRPYKSDWIQLVKAAYGANEHDDLASLFCSQLIAAAFQRMELLPYDMPSNNYVPSDFAMDLGGNLPIGCLGKVRILQQDKTHKAKLKTKHLNSNVEIEVSDPISHVNFSETATKRDAQRKQYTVYIINVITAGGVKWMLFKRFSDFTILDKQLRYYYKGVPKLPSKLLPNKLDSSVVQQRRTALQEFTRKLLVPPLCNCALVIKFLTEGRRGVMQLKNYSEENQPKKKKKKKKSGTTPKRKRRKKKANTTSSSNANNNNSSSSDNSSASDTTTTTHNTKKQFRCSFSSLTPPVGYMEQKPLARSLGGSWTRSKPDKLHSSEPTRSSYHRDKTEAQSWNKASYAPVTPSVIPEAQRSRSNTMGTREIFKMSKQRTESPTQTRWASFRSPSLGSRSEFRESDCTPKIANGTPTRQSEENLNSPTSTTSRRRSMIGWDLSSVFDGTESNVNSNDEKENRENTTKDIELEEFELQLGNQDLQSALQSELAELEQIINSNDSLTFSDDEDDEDDNDYNDNAANKIDLKQLEEEILNLNLTEQNFTELNLDDLDLCDFVRYSDEEDEEDYEDDYYYEDDDEDSLQKIEMDL